MRAAASIASLVVLATPAWALQVPKPCDEKDPHIMCVYYDPNDRYQITATRGMAVDVRIGKSEVVARISAGAQGFFRHEKADEMKEENLEHDVTIWPDKAGRSNLVILTVDPKAGQRRYLLDVKIVEPPEDGSDVPGAAYALDFLYDKPKPKPQPKPEVKQEGAPEANKETKSAAKATPKHGIGETKIASNGPIPLVSDDKQKPGFVPVSWVQQACPPGDYNFAYIGRGDEGRVIAPRCVWDNGRETMFRFAPNTQLPTILIAHDYSGEKDEIVQVTPHGQTMVVQGVHAGFHLYSNNVRFDVFNKRQDTIGIEFGTGTNSPAVDREVRRARLP